VVDEFVSQEVPPDLFGRGLFSAQHGGQRLVAARDSRKRPCHLEVVADLALPRKSAHVDGAAELGGLTSVPEFGGDSHLMHRDGRRAERGPDVIAVLAEFIGECAGMVKEAHGLATITSSS
jgi:hypothetical protein